MIDEQLIASYQSEFKRTTGQTIAVEYKRGWYNLVGYSGSKGRAADLVKWRDVLKSRPDFTPEVKA